MTTFATEPAVERWQDGWIVPVRIEHHDADGETPEHWTADLLVTRSLGLADLLVAAAEQFPGDNDAAASASAAAVDAAEVRYLRAQVDSLTAALAKASTLDEVRSAAITADVKLDPAAPVKQRG